MAGMTAGTKESPLVRIRGLNKSYARGSRVIPVLRDIDLDIENAGFMALMGPSGSGKSTLLNLIAGIDRPDSGTIEIGGIETTSLAESELASWRSDHVGFIFQFYNLMPVLTALENVELPLLLKDMPRKERRERAGMLLGLVGLSERLDHYPGELSGGEQQRVAISRAMVTDPTILVADEPTGDLDMESAEEVLRLMERLNVEFGKTVILVTHDPKAAGKARTVRRLEKGYLNAAAF